MTVELILLKNHIYAFFFLILFVLENAGLQSFVKSEMLIYLYMAAVRSTIGQSPALLSTI